MSLAVVIITYNEEKFIKKAIDSAKKVSNEIVVIDSNSTDHTVTIAKENGAKVFFRAWDEDFAAQRNFAIDKTEVKWLLYLDADEEITDKLAKTIKAVCEQGEEKVYGFIRVNIAFGQRFRFGAMSPDLIYRLIPRLAGKWQGNVHERLISNLAFGQIKGNLLHYTYTNWEQYFMKFNKYTTIWAEMAFARGKKTNVFGAIIRSFGGFLKMFILKCGFMDGFWGFVMCSMHCMYTLIKYLKLFELQVSGERV